MEKVHKWRNSFEVKKKQGRIHGHQLRTGGQGRKCNCPQLKMFLNAHFLTFRLMSTDRWTDGPTDQRTDQWTDKASYRVACPQLKNNGTEAVPQKYSFLTNSQA